LHVAEALDDQTTLVARGHFANVIFLALEAPDSSLVDDHAAPQHTHAGVARDLAVADLQTGDHLSAWQVERPEHRCVTLVYLPPLRIQHPDHRFLDVVGELVDNIVEADVDAMLLG